MNRLSRRRTVAWLVAALAVLVTPALLFAHARLLRSSPEAGASVGPVSELRLWFSEMPEARFTRIRLFDSTGTSVPVGAPTTEPDKVIVARLERPLGPGRYKVEWRTAAADGHVSAGTYQFRVEGPPASEGPLASPQTPSAQVTPAPVANPIVTLESQPAYATPLRWAELVALLTLVGLAVFRLSISRDAKWTDELSRDSAARALAFARSLLVLFAITTVTRALAQATLLGMEGSRIQSLEMLARFTRWGFGWSVGAVGVVVAAIGLAIAGRGAIGWAVASVGLVAMTASESLTGHSATIAHAPLAIATDVSHLLGAGGWIGGLAAVLLCGMPALKRLGDAERAAAGNRLMRAYHGAAVECVSIVLASALVAAWLRLPRIDALWTSGYGSMLLRKLLFVVLLLIFGFYHWRRVVMPGWADDTAKRFRRTAIAELAIGAIVVAISALLASTSLPS